MFSVTDTALEVIGPLQEALAADIAVVLSRHERKAGGELSDAGPGSSAFSGSADVIDHSSPSQPDGRQEDGSGNRDPVPVHGDPGGSSDRVPAGWDL